MPRTNDSPAQLTFAVFYPAVVTPNGDGSMTVKPGRPITKMSPVELANHFGVNRDTIYHWRQEGIIPPEMVIFAGKRKLKFLAGAVPHLEAHFRKLRE